MKFENEIVLDRNQIASLWNGEHTHIVIGKHDDGTPAFARLSAEDWASMLKEANDILMKAKEKHDALSRTP